MTKALRGHLATHGPPGAPPLQELQEFRVSPDHVLAPGTPVEAALFVDRGVGFENTCLRDARRGSSTRH